MKKMARELCIKELAQELKIKVSENYPEIFRKCYFKSLAKNQFYFIRYLNNSGFYTTRYQENCRHCQGPNSKTHVTNVCPYFTDLKE